MLACGAGCATPPRPAPTTAPVYASIDDEVTAVEEAYANCIRRHLIRQRDGLIDKSLQKETAPTTRAIQDAIDRAYHASEAGDAVQVRRLCRQAVEFMRDYLRLIGVNPNVLHELEESHAGR